LNKGKRQHLDQMYERKMGMEEIVHEFSSEGWLIQYRSELHG